MSTVTPAPTAGQPSVIIVGSGFGGIAAAIELTRNGFDEVTVLESAEAIGGTWHYNTYPGAACDVPSHFYSYSYAQRSEWSRFCSPQTEILGYLRQTASDFGVDKLVVTGQHVTACAWDDARRLWSVTARDSATGEETTRTAQALVLATGQLNQPAYPRIPGLDSFAGHTFHSARWDHDYDLAGKRVAVIGTGASAVQFVPPVAEQAAKLSVFQRTGNWFLPRTNHAYPALVRAAFTRVPGLRKAFRAGLFLYMESLTAAIRHPGTLGRLGRAWSTAFMRQQVPDPELRRKIWPDYTFGCKRVLFSSFFLKALGRPNVDLVTEAITEITPTGLRTADGVEREVDCIIYSTGFRTTSYMFPMAVSGRDHRSLQEEWSTGARAHLGITVAGFPNLFVMYGPNTNTSGGSIIFFLESQAHYIRTALQLLTTRRAASLELRREVEEQSDAKTQARFGGTAWTDCDSWYLDANGRISTNWPGYMREYHAATRAADPAEFELTPAG